MLQATREDAMKRRDVMRLSAAAAVLGAVGMGFGGAALAADKMVFKASDVHPEGYPTVQAVENMGKKLSAATNGRLSVQMFASMQLGGEKEAIEQAQVGAIQLARVSVGALGPVIDDLNVFNLPFLFRDTAHAEKVMDGPIGQELLDKVTSNDKAGLVGLCWMDAGARNMYDTKKPINSIADLKGLKVRVMGNPMFVEMMNDLGGNGIAMGYDQVFSALQTGVVDGAENNPPSFVFDNHYQVAKNYTLTEHLIVPEMLVFSKKTWNTLSKDDQALMLKLAKETQADERVLWNKVEADAFAKMKAAGITPVKIADKKPFQDAVKPVWDKYGAKYADMIKRIQAVQERGVVGPRSRPDRSSKLDTLPAVGTDSPRPSRRLLRSPLRMRKIRRCQRRSTSS
jgi:tripartite ATP-independent transporter DctP family solute receptor